MDRSSDNPRDLSNGQFSVHSTGTTTDRVEPRTTASSPPITAASSSPNTTATFTSPIAAASSSSTPNTSTSSSPNTTASPPTPNPPTETSARPSASSTSQHVHSNPSPFHDLYSQFEQQAARELNGMELDGLGDLPASVLNLLIGVMKTAKNTALDRLAPVQNFSGNDEIDCCICLDDIITGEEVRKLPCCHTIHKECIDPWFKKTTRCPMCRTNYVEAGIRQWK